MKKIISTALAATLALSSFGAFAQENHITLISEPVADIAVIPEIQSDKLSYNGTVKEIGEDYILFSGETEIRFNTGDSTYICDYDLNPVEKLKEGDTITVVASSAMTRSIHPQSQAHYILVRTDENSPAPIYAQVASNSGTEIMSADGNNRIVFDENTPVTANKIRIALKGQDITVGSDIIAFASVVGMSLPAHVPAEKIAVLNLAPVEEEKEPEHDVEKITFGGITYEIPLDYITSELFGNASERLPLRIVCEAMGYTVTWNGADESITLSKDGKETTLYVGKPMVEGLSEVPVVIDGTTYVSTLIFKVLGGSEADIVEAEQGVIEVR